MFKRVGVLCDSSTGCCVTARWRIVCQRYRVLWTMRWPLLCDSTMTCCVTVGWPLLCDSAMACCVTARWLVVWQCEGMVCCVKARWPLLCDSAMACCVTARWPLCDSAMVWCVVWQRNGVMCDSAMVGFVTVRWRFYRKIDWYSATGPSKCEFLIVNFFIFSLSTVWFGAKQARDKIE